MTDTKYPQIKVQLTGKMAMLGQLWGPSVGRYERAEYLPRKSKSTLRNRCQVITTTCFAPQ